MHVEDDTLRKGGPKQVSCSAVRYTLRLPGRSRCIEHEEIIFGLHRLAGAIGSHQRSLLVCPHIATLLHCHGATGTLVDEACCDTRSHIHGLITDLFQLDNFLPSEAFVCSHTEGTFSIDHA